MVLFRDRAHETLVIAQATHLGDAVPWRSCSKCIPCWACRRSRSVEHRNLADRLVPRSHNQMFVAAIARVSPVVSLVPRPVELIIGQPSTGLDISDECRIRVSFRGKSVLDRQLFNVRQYLRRRQF